MHCHCPMLLILHVLELLFALAVVAVTGNIVYKFSEARAFNDKYDFLEAPIPALIDDLLATPIRIYIGLGVGIWTVLVAIYIIIILRWRDIKIAPRAAIIILESLTLLTWLCATVALALFAIEIEPICWLADEIPVIRKITENCLITKIGTVFAALSAIIWFITCIATCCQGRGSRKKSRDLEEKRGGLPPYSQNVF